MQCSVAKPIAAGSIVLFCLCGLPQPSRGEDQVVAQLDSRRCNKVYRVIYAAVRFLNPIRQQSHSASAVKTEWQQLANRYINPVCSPS